MGSATARLNRAGVLSSKPLLAHVNYADDALLEWMTGTEATVVWCPRTHRFFGHAAHRWREMLARGINVCVGTDSLASNDSLSILDELRFVRQAAPDVEPDLILEMGTIRAAGGLGLAAEVGSLRPGKLADFVAVPWANAGPAEPGLNLLDQREEVRAVWVGGVPLLPGKVTYGSATDMGLNSTDRDADDRAVTP
jgi:cytosine/adenosine deaminase-related metal-dependent hydrolase